MLYRPSVVLHRKTKKTFLTLLQASDKVMCWAENGFLYSATPEVGVASGSSTRSSGLPPSHGLSMLMTNPVCVVVKLGCPLCRWYMKAAIYSGYHQSCCLGCFLQLSHQ